MPETGAEATGRPVPWLAQRTGGGEAVFSLDSEGRVDNLNAKARLLVAGRNAFGERIEELLPLRDLGTAEAPTDETRYVYIEGSEKPIVYELFILPRGVGEGWTIAFRPSDGAEDPWESAERVRLALESAGLGWWHVDLASGEITFSERFRELVGLAPGETLEYERSLTMVHPEDVDTVITRIQEAIQPVDPMPYDLHYRTLLPHGGYRWLRSRGQAYFEGEGEDRKAVRFIGTIADTDVAKKAEESVEISWHRYRTLVESIDEGFCVIEMLYDDAGEAIDYRFVEVNAAFEGQTGLVNPVGKTAYELVPNLEKSWVQMYNSISQSGEPIRFEQGSVAMGRVFSVYAFRIGSQSGDLVALLFSDITRQETAKQELEAAHGRVTSILESISDAFVAMDSKWRFTYVNPAAEALLDRQPGDLIGVTMWDEYPGMLGSEFETAYRAAAAGTETSFTAFYPVHQRWYEVTATPAEDGITVYFRNVTEQRRHEENQERRAVQAEAEREALERAHAESMAFVAVLKGWDLVFEYVNDPYYQLIGHREVLGKPLVEALPEVSDQGFVELLRAVILTGERFDAPELPVMLQNTPGAALEERFVSLRYSPITEKDGSISGVYAHGIDITELVRSRRLLAERAEETALGSRRKDEFLAILAHELRNPLAPIRLSTDLMKILDPGDEEFDEAREVIARQVEHMTRLVDDLLDVGRVAQGKIRLRNERLDLRQVVAAAVETSRPLLESGGHEFSTDFSDSAVCVDGDRTRLAQILSNLLNNAAKYTEAGGKIRLSVGQEGDKAIVRVSDTGLGIPPEKLESIFDMFMQVEDHANRAQGGLGIGLTLTKRLVELHRGTLTAESDGLGQGSTFTLRLPAQSPIEASCEFAPIEVSGGDDSPIAPRRILVVDDNADVSWSLSEVLQAMGHEVRVAHTGTGALDATAEFRPDVVLLDLGLPDIPGYEVARRLRSAPGGSELRIIAQTGWGREEDRALGKAAGFDEHLVKPVSGADLQRVLRELG